ncbi:putative membrane protein [Mycobacterium basiliense]|uniref:Putative membrane protein n=2 Tax=Mycobacterium basiliense TaxID=2094119 RepID=A0A447GH74_9MYCO|nr:putative membrane protein [Mycobacterium basiliense]
MVATMTASHHAVISRLTVEFDALSRQLARVSGELGQLDRLIAESAGTPRFAPPQPTAPYWQYWAPAAMATPVAAPPRPYPAPPPRQEPPPRTAQPTPPAARDSGWIGKLLAVAGVAVTLIGVALLLVLAAQAGLLRPQIRVAGGTLLSMALVGVGARLRGRPGGRIGAIALAATGIAAAYLDVIALTTIYQWVPAPIGLALAAVVGGAGLTLARRWDSEYLSALVLIPLIGLAPVITGGADLLLVCFMLALSAAALPVQLGKDWIWLHTARIAATTLPLLAALVVAGKHEHSWLLGGACGIAAILAITGAVMVLPGTRNVTALALLTATGTLPALTAAVAVDRAFSAVLAAALAAALLTIVAVGGPPRIVGQIWSSWAAISTLVAVTVACNGYVEGPVLLALAVIVALAGRHDDLARWIAAGFGLIGTGLFYSYAPLHALLRATVLPSPISVSTLAASLLVLAFAVVMSRACVDVGRQNPDIRRLLGAGTGALIVYAITAFTVTAGVLVGGTAAGFLAGHMAATICWIGLAAALFSYALRRADRKRRTAPITAGLALTAAATTKLFLFDLATLDGIFRVAAFIVVGLVLLGMGTGYARSLAR